MFPSNYYRKCFTFSLFKIKRIRTVSEYANTEEYPAIGEFEQYFPVVLFIMLYEVVVTFESVDKILKCDHSNESY